MSTSPIVVCLYRVRRGREDEFTELLKRHGPNLRTLGLATDDPPQYLSGFEQEASPSSLRSSAGRPRRDRDWPTSIPT